MAIESILGNGMYKGISGYQKLGLISFHHINRFQYIRDGINILKKKFPENLKDMFYIFKNNRIIKYNIIKPRYNLLG